MGFLGLSFALPVASPFLRPPPIGPPTAALSLSPFVFNGARTAARPDQDPSMSVISKAASAAALFYGLSAASPFAQDTQVLPSIGLDSEDRPAGPVSSEILLRAHVAPRDRKCVVEGRSLSVSVDSGGRWL